jgi:hypothetical protein
MVHDSITVEHTTRAIAQPSSETVVKGKEIDLNLSFSVNEMEEDNNTSFSASETDGDDMMTGGLDSAGEEEEEEEEYVEGEPMES